LPKILDRYLVRAILTPLTLGLLLFTFVLMIPPILNYGQKLIEKGVDWAIVGKVLLTLVPQALGITIPMALLLGILLGLGRMSADREFVALQACGVSVFRIFRPIGVLALVGFAATAYDMIVALPDANQAFRQITFNIVAAQAEGDVKPRAFFTGFANRVIYVRDIPSTGGWRDVFLADDSHVDQITAYFARRGRLSIDRGKRRVELVLEEGTRYTTFKNKPEDYESSSFDRLVLNMDAEAVFPRAQLLKGDNEMTIAELRKTAEENRKNHAPFASQLFTIQQKLSIPAACLVLSMVGLGLGVTNRKDGNLSSFSLGFGVIFVYYVLLYSSRATALGGRISPTWAPWIPNIVLGIVGIALMIWRAGSTDQPIRFSWPRLWRFGAARSAEKKALATSRAGRPRVVVVIRIPRIELPRPRLLDIYVARKYGAIFCLAFVSLVGIFYISTFIDLADKLFRGSATTGMLLRYFYFQTPQYVYYIIPLAALTASLVTVGVLTKNSELIVMRACGVSLYRSAVPILLFGVLFSGVLFQFEEYILADANRQAARLNAMIRGYPVQDFGVLNRRWIVGQSGDIYHYEFFDQHTNHFSNLSMFHIDDKAWKLSLLTYARDVSLAPAGNADSTRAGTPDGATSKSRLGPEARLAAKSASIVADRPTNVRYAPGEKEENERDPAWIARSGWVREFTSAKRRGDVRVMVDYKAFDIRPLSLEPPNYFKTEEPDSDRMTYGELKLYLNELQTSGYGYQVVPLLVKLHGKLAFPFVTVIMTLLAVPFAVTTGRRGALYGIGIGIVMSIVYYTMMQVFIALGAGGALSPLLAAWAPNILFACAAVYLLLTVKT